MGVQQQHRLLRGVDREKLLGPRAGRVPHTHPLRERVGHNQRVPGTGPTVRHQLFYRQSGARRSAGRPHGHAVRRLRAGECHLIIIACRSAGWFCHPVDI